MSTKKYKLTPEGLTTDRRRGMLLDATEDRIKMPEAFLFTVEELNTIYKAREALIEVADKYRDIPEDNYTPELKNTMLIDYEKAFKRKRAPLTNLRKFADKLKTAFYWSASLNEVKIFGKYGLKPFEIYQITTSTPEQYPEKIINPETCPEFYTAQNKAKQAEALGIPALYLFVTKTELQILQSIKMVVEQIQEQKKQTEESTTKSGGVFIPIINSPEMNGPFSIGENARKNPERTMRLSETGEQINIYEYLTNLKGVKIAFESFNPLAGQGFISVGDPNTDKLLLQAQAITLTTSQKELIIPMSDFMGIRSLSDNKTANEKARGACNTLLSCSTRIDASVKNASIYGGFHYVQECFVVQKKGRGGNFIRLVWTDNVYKHLMEMKDAGRQIEQIDVKILSIPDNHGTAYNIARAFSSHLRKNAEKPTARRLSVKNLLSYCPRLPLYPQKEEEFGQENYIRKPFEAITRIIQPFCKELNFLVDAGIIKEFKFTHEGGRSLSKEEHKRLENDFEFFSKLVLELVFNNEPKYEHLIESKTKQIEKAKKAKKTPKNKK